MKHAFSEAKKVLRRDSIIILSIANGVLCSEKNLIIQGTEFVDLYRNMDMIRLIVHEMKRIKFKEIKVLPTDTEIFLSAIK